MSKINIMRIALYLRQLSFLFHFLTKICACFSSLETSAIDFETFNTMCRTVNHNSWSVIFCCNRTYFTGVLGHQTFLAAAAGTL